MLQGLAYDVRDRLRGDAKPCHLADRLKGLDGQFCPLIPAETAFLLPDTVRDPRHILFPDAGRHPLGDGRSQRLPLFFIGRHGPRRSERHGIAGTNEIHRLHGPFGLHAFGDPLKGLVHDRLNRQSFLPGFDDDLMRPDHEAFAESALLHFSRQRNDLIRIDACTDGIPDAGPDLFRCAGRQPALRIRPVDGRSEQHQDRRYGN